MKSIWVSMNKSGTIGISACEPTLDTNCGYFQITLSKQNRWLVTLAPRQPMWEDFAHHLGLKPGKCIKLTVQEGA